MSGARTALACAVLVLPCCSGPEGGVAVHATLSSHLAGEVKAIQVAFLARPASQDCRFILASGCLAAQQRPVVELADGSKAARLDFAPAPGGRRVTIEGIPIGRYTMVVEALGEGDRLVGNACEPVVEVRETNADPLSITLKSWLGPSCTASFQ